MHYEIKRYILFITLRESLVDVYLKKKKHIALAQSPRVLKGARGIVEFYIFRDGGARPTTTCTFCRTVFVPTERTRLRFSPVTFLPEEPFSVGSTDLAQ